MKKITWLLTVAVLFCALCVVVLSACGNIENPETTTTNSSTLETSKPDETGKIPNTSSPSASEGLTFAFDESTNGYSVTGIGSCTDTDIVIPSQYDGKFVTSIGEYAFSNCVSLENITLPDGLTSIGKWAFQNCASLTSITLSDSLMNIGERAFSICQSLTSITIPDSVTSIGERAFSGCTNLGITVSENNPNYCSINGVLYNKDQTELISAHGAIQAIVIPDSVTSIGEWAFEGCQSFESITIPDSVTKIGKGAFSDCQSLTSITIPNSVTSMGDYVFYDCQSLESIVIPDRVTYVGDEAFYNCRSLTDIYCEVTSQPVKWSYYWLDDCQATVHWGGTWEYVDGVPKKILPECGRDLFD